MQTKEWLYEWLEHYVKPSVKQKTYSRYREIITQHILLKFGDCELEEPLQRYISELMESGNLVTGKGLSANTVNAIITVIQSSLKVAYNLNYNRYVTPRKKYKS